MTNLLALLLLQAVDGGLTRDEFERQALELEVPSRLIGYELDSLEANGFVGVDAFPPSPLASLNPLVDTLKTFFSTDWCGNNVAGTTDWHLATVRAKEAWAVSTAAGRPAKGEGSVVCHIDTGSSLHPDLSGGYAEAGFDVRAEPDDLDPTDEFEEGNPGHGTSTASMIIGPHGVAPAARVYEIRATPTVILLAGEHQRNVAAAIRHATQRGCDVISMSLGTVFWEWDMRMAILDATNAGVIVIAAAGNCTGGVTVPGAYPGVIAVGATNSQDKPWRYTAEGKEVAIAAPGDSVTRAWAKSKTDFATAPSSGTSYATAQVAGAAALWLAHHRQAIAKTSRPALFRAALKASARPGQWQLPVQLGAGILDLAKLLTIELPSEPPAQVLRAPREELRERLDALLAADPSLKNELAALPNVKARIAGAELPRVVFQVEALSLARSLERSKSPSSSVPALKKWLEANDRKLLTPP